MQRTKKSTQHKHHEDSDSKDAPHINVPEKSLPIQPVTFSEIEDTTSKRIDLITKEFDQGFKFIRDYPRSVTFFGGARFTEDHPYYKKAVSVAEKIVSELGYAIVTGGGPGVMEAGNRGADNKNGDSLGLTIKLPFEQATNPYVTDFVDFNYFFTRKVCMTFSAEAYFYFPGGYGTLDEFFEVLTLVQTKKIEPVPLVLVGVEYWKGLVDFMKEVMLTNGTIDKADLSLFTLTDDEDEMIKIVKNAPIRTDVGFHHHDALKKFKKQK